MSYERPPNRDFLNAREFEEEVGASLPLHRAALDSKTELDFWVPGYFLDVKEKKQHYGEKWTKLWPDVPERDMFILDELSSKKVLDPRYGGCGYFLFRDCLENRLFVASGWEVHGSDHLRINRETSPNHRKGKWILNLAQFRRVDSLGAVDTFIKLDILRLPWKQSACLVPTGDV